MSWRQIHYKNISYLHFCFTIKYKCLLKIFILAINFNKILDRLIASIIMNIKKYFYNKYLMFKEINRSFQGNSLKFTSNEARDHESNKYRQERQHIQLKQANCQLNQKYLKPQNLLQVLCQKRNQYNRFIEYLSGQPQRHLSKQIKLLPIHNQNNQKTLLHPLMIQHSNVIIMQKIKIQEKQNQQLCQDSSIKEQIFFEEKQQMRQNTPLKNTQLIYSAAEENDLYFTEQEKHRENSTSSQINHSKKEACLTNNFLATMRSVYLKYLKEELGKKQMKSNQYLDSLKKKPWMKKRDFNELHKRPQFKECLDKLLLTEGKLETLLSKSKCTEQTKQVFIQKCYIMREAYINKEFYEQIHFCKKNKAQ